MAIDWDHLTQPRFDRIVEALIQRLYASPGVEVVAYDGRGGDGGRDVVVRIGSQVLLFQLKYFRDGFSSERRSRRRQIKKSFETAVTDYNPTAWFLVVPTNPTPGEEEFINSLAAMVSGVKVRIRGRSFLDERLSANPDLVGYLSRNWLQEEARDYGQERAILLGGLPDLTERHRNLNRIAATLDPHWRVDTAVRDGVVEHTLRAKHPLAPQISPITVTVATKFGPEHAALKAAVHRSLGFGTREPVTLPPETISALSVTGPAWLSMPESAVEVTWTPAGSPPDAPTVAEFDVLGADGEVLSSHHGTVSHAGSGPVGFSVQIDFNSAATLTVLIGRDGLVQFDGMFPFTNVMPAIASENILLFRDLHCSHGLDLRLDSTAVGRFTLSGARTMEEQTAAELAVRELLVEDLEIVQRHCRAFFPVPAELSVGDRIEIRLARLLVEGHCVVSRTAQTWTAILNGEHSDVLDQVLSSDTPQTFRISGPLVIQVLGRRLQLGEASFFHTQVDIPDRADILAALRGGHGAGRRLVLAPINGQHYRVYLPRTWTGRDDQPLIPTPWGLPGLDGPPNG